MDKMQKTPSFLKPVRNSKNKKYTNFYFIVEFSFIIFFFIDQTKHTTHQQRPLVVLVTSIAIIFF